MVVFEEMEDMRDENQQGQEMTLQEIYLVNVDEFTYLYSKITPD